MKTKARTENAHGGCGAARLLACSSCGEMPTMTHSIYGPEKYAVWCDRCKTAGPLRVYRMRAARDWNKSQQANEKAQP
jgi:hypothetical protein